MTEHKKNSTMKLNKLFKTVASLAGIILILMIIFKDAQSEIFTVLSTSLSLLLFYSLLYYLFQTEIIKYKTKNPLVKYIFFGISIPLLVFGVEATKDTDGFLQNAIRVSLFLEVSYLIFYWVFRYIKSIQQLKSDKLEAELMLLKNQINPHFFFNTLNNLYSLIKKDADAAQDYVLKLSDLMRFTIYDSGKENVKLEDEINYLVNFIDLQTARYHKEIDVHFEKVIQDSGASIAPLLFINLLENAFKHGVERVTEDAFIHIKLIDNEHKTSFFIKNNYDAEERVHSNGIGLKNLKNRLNLLYPKRHILSSEIDGNTYSTTLEIFK